MLWDAKLSPRARKALANIRDVLDARLGLTPADLLVLGHELVPREIVQRLHPDQTLILSGHGSLHNLPWPALMVAHDRHLIEAVSLAHVPSLLY